MILIKDNHASTIFVLLRRLGNAKIHGRCLCPRKTSCIHDHVRVQAYLETYYTITGSNVNHTVNFGVFRNK
jgi:hypothetical protein